jgi:ABC-type sugar transport system ATPase subunit
MWPGTFTARSRNRVSFCCLYEHPPPDDVGAIRESPLQKEKSIPCVLEVIEPLGERKILTLKLDEAEFKIPATREVKGKPGEVVWLEFDTQNICIFHEETGESLLRNSPRKG